MTQAHISHSHTTQTYVYNLNECNIVVYISVHLGVISMNNVLNMICEDIKILTKSMTFSFCSSDIGCQKKNKKKNPKYSGLF